MILVVDWRDDVSAAYASEFRKEGMAAMGLGPEDFGGWLHSAVNADILAVETFVLGECPRSELLPELIKGKSSAPIIALTDGRRLEKTLLLFAAGADDVVDKPIHVREILARAGAIRRRSAQLRDPQCGDIRVFSDGRDPLVGGENLHLPRRERRILEYLSNNCERWVQREQLFAAIYGTCEDAVADTTIECHISKLRRKLRLRLGYDPIECRRYLGYQLNCKKRSLTACEFASDKPQRAQTSLGQVSLSL